METYVIFVICAVFSVTVIQSQSPSVTKHYRSDYVYNRKTDAFYKLHIESRIPSIRETVCSVEGAKLMSPSSDDDIRQLHGMFKQYPDMGDYVAVADDGDEHESAESPLIDLNPTSEGNYPWTGSRCLVVNREGAVETISCFRPLPFICKVNAKDAPYDKHCGVFGKDYQYYSSVKSCYKVPGIAYTWSEAYDECQTEGAHLVVLNSETEREIVQNITNKVKKLPRARASWFFFAGFRATKPNGNATNIPIVFKTIFNQTLEQAGFNQWSPNEPNNALGREYCGSIFTNDGKLNDLDCTHSFGFVCEKEVGSK